MRNILKAGAVLAAAALAFSACGSPAGTTSPTGGPGTTAEQLSGELTVWVDSNREPVLKTVAEKFKADTGVTIKLVVKDFNSIRDDFITTAQTGKGPDVIIGAHDWTGKLVQNGVVAPVELGATAGNFQDVSVKAMTYEGRVYGVPYATENIALLRNTDLAPNAPASFDDLLKTGKEAVSAGKAKYPILIGLDPRNSDPFHLYPLQASYGAPVFNLKDDGSYDGKTVAMGGENGAKFANALSQWGKDKVLNLSVSQDISKEQFAKGASPYLITGPWTLDLIKKSNIKYAIDPIPSAGGQPATPFVGVQGFFVSAKSTNTVAANKFLIEYIGSKDVQLELYKVGNRPPANKEALSSVSSDADVTAFGKAGESGVPMPNVPQMDLVWTDWGTAQVTIIKGTADPAGVWQKMVEAIQAKIK